MGRLTQSTWNKWREDTKDEIKTRGGTRVSPNLSWVHRDLPARDRTGSQGWGELFGERVPILPSHDEVKRRAELWECERSVTVYITQLPGMGTDIQSVWPSQNTTYTHPRTAKPASCMCIISIWSLDSRKDSQNRGGREREGFCWTIQPPLIGLKEIKACSTDNNLIRIKVLHAQVCFHCSVWL